MPAPFRQAARGNYLPGRAGNIAYIVVHYTGNRGDTAKNNADYFAREWTGTSAHYFVDRQEVWQSVRDEDTAYHCGSTHPKHPACRNYNSIGVEMCDSVGAVPAATMARTAALVRELMDRYSIPADHVLRHCDVTGKRCPAPWVDSPREWAAFKAMLEVEEVTQEQFDAYMDNYLDRKAQEPATMPDQVAEAVTLGISTNGDRPRAFLTREEGMVMAKAAVRAALAGE